MQSLTKDFVPIRIAGILPCSTAFCADHPDMQAVRPHLLPNCCFAVLVWMPTMNKAPESAPDMPFVGHARTPPVEIAGVQISNRLTKEFMRFIHYN